MHGGSASVRKHRPVVAAQGTLEIDFIAAASKHLGRSDAWKAMPPWAHTVDNQHLAFAVISRSMCLVNDQCEASCAYPLRAFLLLVDPTMADAIMAEKCQWDAWTAMFVGSHAARGGIASRDALEHLRATALVLQLDTAQLEASHAAVRRVSCMLSTQTHGESFLDASAESVLRRARAHGDLLAQALGATVDRGCRRQRASQRTPCAGRRESPWWRRGMACIRHTSLRL